MKRLALILFVLMFALPARAQDYTRPTWASLVHTLIRFNALSLDDDRVIDDYGAVTECDLYKAMHGDDFQWNKVRTAMRDDVRQKIATFPINYGYVTQLQLDHYDFQNKEYRLTDKTVISRVNTFVIYQNDGNACGILIKNIPGNFHVVLDTPVSFDGLPLEEKDAQALSEQMKAGNPDKVVTARFNLRITYIEPLRRANIKGEDLSSGRSNAIGKRDVRLDAHLDSVDFFEDSAMTRLIYSYRPD